ncbi:hypothetical protein E2C01_047388 [Portunus trituberculatus]|uniref:Uncharacterized protein n=1 Tax=Portunus trituberculatus TaxID=210409 RepID=A0A5B7GAC5_PORTR|nr:hypothetical protein [Portunus trituberculatus]
MQRTTFPHSPSLLRPLQPQLEDKAEQELCFHATCSPLFLPPNKTEMTEQSDNKYSMFLVGETLLTTWLIISVALEKSCVERATVSKYGLKLR